MRKLLPLLLIFLTSISLAKSTNSTTNMLCSTEILAKQWQHGYTWTLTSRLGELLDKAERLMGERDKAWTVLGVEFSTTPYPQTWYPGIQENRKDIIIQLTQSSANDKKRALFQLAHEVIHLLSPTGKPQTSTVLEEGIATYFSIHVMQSMGFDITPSYISDVAYEDAYARVKTLIDSHRNAFDGIKTLRSSQTFTDISAKELRAQFKHLTKENADTLSANFFLYSQRLRNR